MNPLPSSPDAGSPAVLPVPVSAHRQVLAAYDKIAAVDRPELWTALRSREDVLVEAKTVDERVRAGERLPLAGLLVVVNDNVELAGAGKPEAGAVAVRRLVRAGALALGKTGPGPRGEITGWSSALAVALGLVDVVVGTEPVGAGEVATAFHGIVGIRPTRGLVPTTGISGRGRGVTVFARGVVDGQRALRAMTGPDESDVDSRHWPDPVRLAAGERPRVAVADPAGLSLPSKEARRAYTRTIEHLFAAGVVVETFATLETIDITSFVEAASLAHGGNPEQRAGQAHAVEALEGCCALVLPTAPARSTRRAGRRHGSYTDFVAVLDMAAVAVPSPQADGGPFGVSVLTRAFDDQVALDLAALLTDEQLTEPYPVSNIDVVVFGAHLRGQPLNHQLADLGARFRGGALTAERYRMVALPTVPPTPGIVRASPGAVLAGERWTISPAGLDRFLAGLPEGMTKAEIELEDGSTALGFRCDADHVAEAKDITKFGDWRAYLRHLTATRPMVPVR